jgi:hypothetical protein
VYLLYYRLLFISQGFAPVLQFVTSVFSDLLVLVRNVLLLINYCTTVTLETGVFTKIQSNNATSFFISLLAAVLQPRYRLYLEVCNFYNTILIKFVIPVLDRVSCVY